MVHGADRATAGGSGVDRPRAIPAAPRRSARGSAARRGRRSGGGAAAGQAGLHEALARLAAQAAPARLGVAVAHALLLRLLRRRLRRGGRDAAATPPSASSRGVAAASRAARERSGGAMGVVVPRSVRMLAPRIASPPRRRSSAGDGPAEFLRRADDDLHAAVAHPPLEPRIGGDPARRRGPARGAYRAAISVSLTAAGPEHAPRPAMPSSVANPGDAGGAGGVAPAAGRGEGPLDLRSCSRWQVTAVTFMPGPLSCARTRAPCPGSSRGDPAARQGGASSAAVLACRGAAARGTGRRLARTRRRGRRT